MSGEDRSIFEDAAYGYAEASQYLRLPLGTLRDWTGSNGLVHTHSAEGLSFYALAELHVLQFLRKEKSLSLQKVRYALEELRARSGKEHPLLADSFATDGVDLFVRDAFGLVNLSQHGQRAIPEALLLHLRRLGRDRAGQVTRLFPFIAGAREDAPRHISMDPRISFGRPVLDGTAVLTAVLAGRFGAGDSIQELAAEYGVTAAMIEDAIRLEAPLKKAA